MRKPFRFCLILIFSLLAFSNNAAPLPKDQAFQLRIKQSNSSDLLLTWQLKPGYFLYKDKLSFNAEDSGITIGKIHYPKNDTKKDSRGKLIKIYRDELILSLPILSEQAGESIVDIHYQGCADDGFCYPPTIKKVKLTINSKLELIDVSFIDSDSSIIKTKDSLELLYQSHNWPMVLLIFFGFGLLLAFTPCVLPMIPVLSGIIIGHGKDLSTRKAFLLSLSYVLAMALTYAIAGAIVALLGSNIQMAMQSSWTISLFAILFVVLALSMFGYFDLKLPLSWQAKLAKLNRKQNSGHYLSAAIMGALSILILSPCVTPPLIAALGYIANSGNIAMGSLSLFVLALGMGTPLLLIGVSAGRFLPKAGGWMLLVKSFFGVLLLAVAISLFSRIISAQFTMFLWSFLAIFTGVYVGALTKSYSGRDKFKQALGLIILVYGLCILLGAAMGNTNPLKPLENFGKDSLKKDEIIFKTTHSTSELNSALEEVKGSRIILDFYADWCTSCKLMESEFHTDPEIRAKLKEFALIKVDITANNPEVKELMKLYSVIAPPTLIFLNSEGTEINELRIVGEIEKELLIKKLSQAY